MEQFGYLQPRLQPWRLQGVSPSHDDVQDMTEQNAVPSLSSMLVSVLQGRGTGLSDSQYDEDDDFDASLTDKIDLEMQRQTIAERVVAARKRKEQATGEKSPSQSTDKIVDKDPDGGNPPATAETET